MTNGNGLVGAGAPPVVQETKGTHTMITSTRTADRSMIRHRLAALTAVGLLVAGCGSDDTDSPTETPVDTSSTSGAPADADASAAESDDESTTTYTLNATGQTTCYDLDAEITCPEPGEEFYGQDANFTAGQAMAFEDNGDGTVTDVNTGLTWQQAPTSDDFTWQEAVDYANDLELGGYDDWRMPSAKELFSISDFSEGWPYLDTDYFDLAGDEITKDEQYWTSNYYVGVTVEGGSDAAFGVNHVTGHIKAYSATSGGPVGGKYVRAVRGDDYGANDFVDNGDSTITDDATGLMWAQSDDGVELDWPDALAYAEDSELAGYDDWRLPTVKELQSIVDYTKSPSATDSSAVGPAVDDLFSVTEITNEAGDSDYGYYWTSTSANFTSGEPYYYAWYVAFGRAVDDSGADSHGAGAVRFDTKTDDGPDAEGGERYENFVLLVRDAA